MSKILWLTIIISIIVSNNLISGRQDYSFDLISSEDGLPNNTIYDIMQDREGFLWFATDAGLSKYDGYQFVNYYSQILDSASLTDPTVRCIFQDSKDQIWIGTDNGLNILNTHTGEITKIDQHNSKNKLSNFFINSIFEDSKGRMIIGHRNGFSVYYPQKDQYKEYLNLEKPGFAFNNQVNCIFEYSDSTFWVGTRGSMLYHFNTKFELLDSFRLKNIDPKWKDVQLTSIYIITKGDNDNLWLGTSIGLVRLSISSKQFRYLNLDLETRRNTSTLDVKDIVQKDDILWLCTDNGLVRYEISTGKFEQIKYDPYNPIGLSDNALNALCLDRTNILWIGTHQNGVNKLNISNRGFSSYYYKLDEIKKYGPSSVYAIHEDADRDIWFGTIEGVVTRIDYESGEFEHYQLIPYDKVVGYHVPISSIVEDRHKQLWIGTMRLWLLRFNPYTKKLTAFRRFEDKPKGLGSYSLREMLIDSLNRLWITSFDLGLDILDLDKYYSGNSQNTVFRHYLPGENTKAIHSQAIRSIAEIRKNLLAIGTRNGLELFFTKKDSFILFQHIPGDLTSISSNDVVALCPSAKQKDILWVGTNNGLCKFNLKSRVFTGYSIEQGLQNPIIQGILEAGDGRVWLSTLKGISSFNPETEEFSNYNKDDGLLDESFNSGAYFKSPVTGKMYFGNTKGIVYFHPDSLIANTVLPEIVLTDLYISNQKVGIKQNINGAIILNSDLNHTSNITLNRQSNDFRLEFAALHYINPQKNHYKYKLIGYDKNWIYTDSRNRSASYANLPPGKYTFVLYGSNNTLNWSRHPLTLDINIEPAWWQTWIFRVLVVVFCLIIIYFIYLTRVNILQKQKKALELKVQERTSELRQMNSEMEERQEEIFNQNEELKQQRDYLDKSNQQVKLQNDIILRQKEELEKHRNELEKLILERTKELQQALIKAEESDRLKSSFIANISHEIRTPLNAIMGFAGLICSDEFDQDRKQDFSEHIEQNSDRLLFIINDLLDLSLIESGQLKMKFDPVNINAFLQELYDTFKLKNKNKKVQLKLELNDLEENLHIVTDKTRLGQIFNNLVDNSLKFTERGIVEFGVKYFNPGTRTMQFYVKDTGMGIDAAHLSSIFNEFHKIEEPTKLFRGTGLGLAIVKKIVDKLNGKIHVTSEKNKGSEFIFDIPFQMLSDLNKEEEKQISEDSLNFTNIHCLVAEDEESNFKYLQIVLSKTRMRITWARDGKEALDLANEDESINLVLMDIKMPVMNGLEAMKLIKAGRPELPVVAQTAFASPDEEFRFLKEGFDAYISKPIRKENLLKLIEDLVRV